MLSGRAQLLCIVHAAEGELTGCNGTACIAEVDLCDLGTDQVRTIVVIVASFGEGGMLRHLELIAVVVRLLLLLDLRLDGLGLVVVVLRIEQKGRSSGADQTEIVIDIAIVGVMAPAHVSLGHVAGYLLERLACSADAALIGI